MDEEDKTPEQVEQERLAREASKNKRKNNPDAPIVIIPEPEIPPVVDNAVTSIRTATPEDPDGAEEVVIDNNVREVTDDNSFVEEHAIDSGIVEPASGL